MKVPDKMGHFGAYGGRYVSETLMPSLLELEHAYNRYRNDPDFKKELNYYFKQYVGRKTPLYFAERFTEHLGGPKVYLKREDLDHTGAQSEAAVGTKQVAPVQLGHGTAVDSPVIFVFPEGPVSAVAVVLGYFRFNKTDLGAHGPFYEQKYRRRFRSAGFNR